MTGLSSLLWGICVYLFWGIEQCPQSEAINVRANTNSRTGSSIHSASLGDPFSFRPSPQSDQRSQDDYDKEGLSSLASLEGWRSPATGD